MPLLPAPSRRDLLKLAAAMPALALPALTRPAPALAALGKPLDSQPAHFRFSLGAFRLTVISDGYLSLPTSGLVRDVDINEVRDFLVAHRLSARRSYSHTNHLLIETPDARVLIDIGSGNRFLDTAGRLMENLDRAGIDPAEITHVVVTHAHPDHVWGIRDDFDEPVLPDATYVMGRAEHDWWLTEDRVNMVPQRLQQFVVGAVNSLTAEGLEWTLLEDGQEVVPGVTLLATPGHTPGHMSIHVESEGNRLLALGDAMTHAYVSVERPEWTAGFDQVPDQAVATRRRLLDMAATEEVAVLGYHFPFPGVGHIMRQGEGYRFVPALWQWEG